MWRLIPFLAGAGVLIAGGLVHGLWTDRWRPSEELRRAGPRLAALPTEIGGWKSRPQEQEADSLAMAGAVAHYSRAFTDPATGESVLVILLAGTPRKMSIHRPEDCYRAAGYELAGAPLKLTVTPAGEPGTDLWTGLFTRDDPAKGLAQMRIFWTWYAGGEWRAPDNPRWAFARERALYKLYVIRAERGQTPLAADPCVRLLGELLPVLNRALGED